mgnify:CR=1 FL=1
MKRLDFLLGALALVAATMATSPAAAAQENGNRDDYGKVIDNLNLGTTIYPKTITAENILKSFREELENNHN